METAHERRVRRKAKRLGYILHKSRRPSQTLPGPYAIIDPNTNLVPGPDLHGLELHVLERKLEALEPSILVRLSRYADSA